MIADNLSKAQIVEDEAGRVWAAGLSGSHCYVQCSTDGGATKAIWPDGSYGRLVSQDTVDDETPAIEAHSNGYILVAVTQGGAVRVYKSELDGWTFTPVGAVE